MLIFFRHNLNAASIFTRSIWLVEVPWCEQRASHCVCVIISPSIRLCTPQVIVVYKMSCFFCLKTVFVSFFIYCIVNKVIIYHFCLLFSTSVLSYKCVYKDFHYINHNYSNHIHCDQIIKLTFWGRTNKHCWKHQKVSHFVLFVFYFICLMKWGGILLFCIKWRMHRPGNFWLYLAYLLYLLYFLLH